MNSKEDIQKYMNEMMQLYAKSSSTNPDNQPSQPIESAATENAPHSAQIPFAPESIEPIANMPTEQMLPDGIEAAGSEFAANQYNDQGFLQVSVTAGEKAFPLADAVVVITAKTPFGRTAMSISATDSNGRTPTITLPAPDTGSNSGNNTPFASYNAEIFLKGYHTVINEDVPVFAGITSLLPVNMIPLPNNASNQRDMIFYSDEPQF